MNPPQKEQGDSKMLMETGLGLGGLMRHGLAVNSGRHGSIMPPKSTTIILKELEETITDLEQGDLAMLMGTAESQGLEDNSSRCGSIMPLEYTTMILNEIMTTLTQSNIVIIGIYGSSNANRENVVEKVSRRVERDVLFNVVVKTSVMKKPDLKRIQGELGNALGLQLHEKTLEERATRLCEKIKMEDKILIILDDLQGEINLAKIGIPFGNDHKGCKILLVAENKDVLSDKMKTQKEFSVDELTRRGRRILLAE